MRKHQILFTIIWLTSFIETIYLQDPHKDCSIVKDSEKFDCYPEGGGNEKSCNQRRCCWKPGKVSTRIGNSLFPPLDVPWCYYPKNFGGYEYIDFTRTDQGGLAFLNRTFPSPYPDDVQNLRLDIQYQTDTRVRVKVSCKKKICNVNDLRKSTFTALSRYQIPKIRDMKLFIQKFRKQQDNLLPKIHNTALTLI